MANILSTSQVNSFPTPSAAPAATGGAAASPDNAAAKKTLNQNFDQFLLLLTTQLKNQDPLSPMDSAQFTNQLVSFSQVEQQIKTNDNLSKLVNLTSASQTMLGLSYIGLNVDMQGSDFEYAGSGMLSMIYSLPADASISTISVLDQNNNVVYSQSGETAAGKHGFVWNGKDNNGDDVAPGVYQLRVGALDKDQKSLSTSTVVPAYVSGITTADDGSINLVVGRIAPRTIPLSSVTQASL